MACINFCKQFATGSLPACVASFDSTTLDAKLPQKKRPSLLLPLLSVSIPAKCGQVNLTTQLEASVGANINPNTQYRSESSSYDVLAFSRHNDSELLGLTNRGTLTVFDLPSQKLRKHICLPLTSRSNAVENSISTSRKHCWPLLESGYQTGVACLTVAEDGPLVAFGLYDGGVALFDMRFWSFKGGRATPILSLPSCHGAPVRSLKIGLQRHSHLLVSAGEDAWIKTFDLRFPYNKDSNGCNQYERIAASMEAVMLKSRIQPSRSASAGKQRKLNRTRLLSAAFSSDGSIAAATLASCCTNKDDCDHETKMMKDSNDGEIQVLSPVENFCLLRSLSAADGCTFKSVDLSYNAKYLLSTVSHQGYHCSRCLNCSCALIRCGENCGLPARHVKCFDGSKKCSFHRAHITNLIEPNFNVLLKTPADGVMAYSDTFCVQVEHASFDGNKYDRVTACGDQDMSKRRKDTQDLSKSMLSDCAQDVDMRLSEAQYGSMRHNSAAKCRCCGLSGSSTGESSDSEETDCDSANVCHTMYYNYYTKACGHQYDAHLSSADNSTRGNFTGTLRCSCNSKLSVTLHQPGSKLVERRRRRFWRFLHSLDEVDAKTGEGNQAEKVTAMSSADIENDALRQRNRYHSFRQLHPQLSQFFSQCGPNHPAFCRAEANTSPLICRFWGGTVVGAGGCETTETCSWCSTRQNLYRGLKLWDASSGTVLSWTEGKPSFDSALSCVEPHPNISTGVVATGGHDRFNNPMLCLFGLEKRDEILMNALAGHVHLNVAD